VRGRVGCEAREIGGDCEMYSFDVFSDFHLKMYFAIWKME
jgi:hypothetical protein